MSWTVVAWVIVSLYAVLIVRASIEHQAAMRRVRELLDALREDVTRDR